MAENKETYQTQFTQENIMELKNYINDKVNDFSKEIKKEKLDIFVVLIALQQASYELVLRNFSENEEDAQKLLDQMNLVSDKLLRLTDESRKEHETKAASEMLALIHSISIVGEFYARRRDEFINNLQNKAEQFLGEEAPASETPAE